MTPTYYKGIASFPTIPDNETLALAAEMYTSQGRGLLFGAPEYSIDGSVCLPTWITTGGQRPSRKAKGGAQEQSVTESSGDQSEVAEEQPSAQNVDIQEFGELLSCETYFEEFIPTANNPDELRIASFLQRPLRNVYLKVAKPAPSLEELSKLECCRGFLEGYSRLQDRLTFGSGQKPNIALIYDEAVSPVPFIELLYRLLTQDNVVTMSSVQEMGVISFDAIHHLPMFVEIDVDLAMTNGNPLALRSALSPLEWRKLRNQDATCVIKMTQSKHETFLKKWTPATNLYNAAHAVVVEMGEATPAFNADLTRLYELLDIPQPFEPETEEPVLLAEGNPFAELDALIGLESVKTQVREYATLLERRGRDALPCLHMTLLGNPGSGKTTVARIIAKIFDNIGVNKRRDIYVETDSGGLIAGYVGQTALKTKAVIARAKGGVLFVDEAYALYNGEGRAGMFAAEALATLVKEMEDKRDEFVCILAGYTQETEDMIKSNPGLRDRIGISIEFPDYSVEELVQIFEKFARDAGYWLGRGSREFLFDYFSRVLAQKDEHFSNGRIVRKVFERARIKQAMRTESNVITKGDLEAATAEGDLAKIAAGAQEATPVGFFVA